MLKFATNLLHYCIIATNLLHVMDVFSHWVVLASKNVPGAQGITVKAWFVQREYTSQR